MTANHIISGDGWNNFIQDMLHAWLLTWTNLTTLKFKLASVPSKKKLANVYGFI